MPHDYYFVFVWAARRRVLRWKKRQLLPVLHAIILWELRL